MHVHQEHMDTCIQQVLSGLPGFMVRLLGPGFRVPCPGIGHSGSRVGVQGSGFRASVLLVQVSAFLYRVQSSGAWGKG